MWLSGYLYIWPQGAHGNIFLPIGRTDQHRILGHLVLPNFPSGGTCFPTYSFFYCHPFTANQTKQETAAAKLCMLRFQHWKGYVLHIHIAFNCTLSVLLRIEEWKLQLVNQVEEVLIFLILYKRSSSIIRKTHSCLIILSVNHFHTKMSSRTLSDS